MALPYLDMVVKETLRLHAPVPSTVREAIKEEIIPVGEPYTDRNGEVQDKIRLISLFRLPRQTYDSDKAHLVELAKAISFLYLFSRSIETRLFGERIQWNSGMLQPLTY